MSQYIKQTIEGVAQMTPVGNPTPVDTVPTEDSDHLITSGGVYEAIQESGGGGGDADYIQVVADGTKNYSTLFTELSVLIDDTKLKTSSRIKFDIVNGEKIILQSTYIGSKEIMGVYTNIRSNMDLDIIAIRISSSPFYRQMLGSTTTNHTTDVPPLNSTIKILY